MRECPRPSSRTISVTAEFRRCFLYEAFAIAHGTVWSCSPAMSSIGPRSGDLVLTFTSVQGFRLADAAWKIGAPDPATANAS